MTDDGGITSHEADMRSSRGATLCRAAARSIGLFFIANADNVLFDSSNSGVADHADGECHRQS